MLVFLINTSIDNYSFQSVPFSTDQTKMQKILLYIQKIFPNRTSAIITYTKLKSKLKKKFQMDDKEIHRILTHFLDLEILFVANDDSIHINILSNETRKQIHTLIKKFPGIYGHYLKKKLQLGSHQILWHIEFLLEFQMIYYIHFGKIRAYGLQDVSSEDLKIGFFILRRTLRNLLNCLMNHPQGCNITTIASDIQLKPNSTIYAIKKLIKHKIITMIDFNQNLYSILPKFSTTIDNCLLQYSSLFI